MLIWTKVLYVSCVVLNLLCALIMYLIEPYLDNLDQIALMQGFLTKAILVGLGILLLGLVSMGLSCVYYVFWLLWLHREGTNLRTVGTTDFPPMLAVFCTSIPLINGIFDFFILRDILRSQGNALLAYGKDVAPMPNRDLNICLVLSLLMIAMCFIDNSVVTFIVIAVLFGATLPFLMNVLKRCMEQGNALFRLHEDAVLRAKVEEVLRERESASAVGEAQAQGEN